MDLLIAAHAVSLDVLLVTNNEAEFKRVPGLKLQNWTRAHSGLLKARRSTVKSRLGMFAANWTARSWRQCWSAPPENLGVIRLPENYVERQKWRPPPQGRGRGFESRRPRHFFNDLQEERGGSP